MSYGQTLNKVEAYFDRTATKAWETLTSDAPVSKIRQTVRSGREEMRKVILSRLPANLNDYKILDAGCGTGLLTADLLDRGASVLAVDISPSLVEIAKSRLKSHAGKRVVFEVGDMLERSLGTFGYIISMDSLIYYSSSDILKAILQLAGRSKEKVVFTIAPKTKLLMLMWYAGKFFPRSDRSPSMVPQSCNLLLEELQLHGHSRELDRVNCGFYISQALEFSK